MRGAYRGKEMGRNRISKLSGTLSRLAMRTGRRRKDPRTRITFPLGRVGTAAARGFQRGSPARLRSWPGIDRAQTAGAETNAASGSLGSLPLREIPEGALSGTNGPSLGPAGWLALAYPKAGEDTGATS